MASPRKRMAEGRLITVVGPSGAGKDSILALVKAALPDIVFVRRTITRAPDGGFENHVSVDVDTFEAQSRAGMFALEWAANGLSYGIPKSIRADLDAGRRVIFNGSRGAMADITAAFPDVMVISIEVNRDILKERLLARARETSEEIEARLDRDVPSFPPDLHVEVIDNSGSLENSVAQMIDILSRETGAGRGE